MFRVKEIKKLDRRYSVVFHNDILYRVTIEFPLNNIDHWLVHDYCRKLYGKEGHKMWINDSTWMMEPHEYFAKATHFPKEKWTLWNLYVKDPAMVEQLQMVMRLAENEPA